MGRDVCESLNPFLLGVHVGFDADLKVNSVINNQLIEFRI